MQGASTEKTLMKAIAGMVSAPRELSPALPAFRIADLQIPALIAMEESRLVYRASSVGITINSIIVKQIIA